MDAVLKNLIIQEHSKPQTLKIIKYVGENKKRLKDLVDLLLKGDALVQQRAGWPLSYIIEKNPELAKPHLKALIKNLSKPKLHNAVKRNTVRLLQFVNIPESLAGITTNVCFNFLNSANEAIAVKVFAMTVLATISKKYPELKAELKLAIENQLPYASAGFKARAKSILK